MWLIINRLLSLGCVKFYSFIFKVYNMLIISNLICYFLPLCLFPVTPEVFDYSPSWYFLNRKFCVRSSCSPSNRRFKKFSAWNYSVPIRWRLLMEQKTPSGELFGATLHGEQAEGTQKFSSCPTVLLSKYILITGLLSIPIILWV